MSRSPYGANNDSAYSKSFHKSPAAGFGGSFRANDDLSGGNRASVVHPPWVPASRAKTAIGNATLKGGPARRSGGAYGK